jgi:hypothetical protein
MQAEAKEKLSFFNLTDLTDIQYLQSTNYTGHFLGFDDEISYPANNELVLSLNMHL